MAINEQALSTAYAAYDSDPRVSGPDDYDAYRVGIEAYLTAADTVGRERVSVAEAEAMLDRYFTNRFEAIMADGQHLAIGFLEQAESERTHLIALLTAAPAERETGDQP